jgi:2-polyprenyl-3-methyl-5-hydroxy-6-metoxy-1,4-benzoquinol methylase
MNSSFSRDKQLHSARQCTYEQCDSYRQSFIDQTTGLLNDDLLETRQCPCCGSSSKAHLFVKNGGSYVQCEDCSMVFLDPVFRDDELLKYYQSNNVAQATAHENELAFYKQIYETGLASVKKLCKTGMILDIGCSSGLFLDIARKAGYITNGIELNESELLIAKAKGHNIWDTPINRISFDTTFDVITLWDVFEHIKDGVGYLRFLKTILKPNGLVFMQIPSVDSLAARILQHHCNMFDGIEHVNLYGASTIDRIATEAGFRIESMVSVIDELGPISNYLSFEDPYKGSFSPDRIEKIFDKTMIIDQLLGYKLQVLLRPC